jgi:hypothetical protein
MRGVLISSIFSKTLNLSTHADFESRTMTLMIADVEGITQSLKHLNEVWACFIETALATWLLERQVGLASLSMIALIICKTTYPSFAYTSYITRISYESSYIATSLPQSEMFGCITFRAILLIAGLDECA